jgi:hypothetical protein
MATQQTRPLFIAPGSLRENAYSETFNGKLQDELQQVELFTEHLGSCSHSSATSRR